MQVGDDDEVWALRPTDIYSAENVITSMLRVRSIELDTSGAGSYGDLGDLYESSQFDRLDPNGASLGN